MKKWIMIALISCVSAFAEEAPKAAPEGETLEQYIARGQKVAAKKGNEFNEKRAKGRFKNWDVNQDGVLTKEEIAAKGKKK
jgi:hypothetical protein